MKIDKQMQKKCELMIKEIAVKKGFKKIQNSIYKLDGEKIFLIHFLIVNSEKLIYSMEVKKKSFDEIFWKTLRMEENINERFSLRVNGAFAAPAVEVSEGKCELSEDIEEIAESFMDKVCEEIEKFQANKDVVECIFSAENMVDEDILKFLAYMDMGKISEAKEFAYQQVQIGNKGRFINLGKGFFEWALTE